MKQGLKLIKTEPADHSPERLLQHIQNLQNQVNTLADLNWALAERVRRLEVRRNRQQELTGLTKKVCKRCHQPKDINDFHRDANNSDGRSLYCKSCESKRFKAIHRKRCITKRERKASNES